MPTFDPFRLNPLVINGLSQMGITTPTPIQEASLPASLDRRDVIGLAPTGTGKTRTALGLMYRLIKSQRFRRVLFLVDRTALGEQAENAFKNVKLENQQSLDEIYDVRLILFCHFLSFQTFSGTFPPHSHQTFFNNSD